MRKFLTSGRRRYALALVVVGASLAVMGAQCQPPKPPPPPTGLSIAPTSKAFADTKTGNTSTAETFTVTNNGPDKSGALAVSLDTGNTNQFVTSNDNCSTKKLDVGDKCTVDAAFNPTATGPLTTNLVVKGDPGGSATAKLSGNGTT